MTRVLFYADDTPESREVEKALLAAHVPFFQILSPVGRTPPAIECDLGYFEGLAQIRRYFLRGLVAPEVRPVVKEA
ncbi:MAG: hypothetical protein FJX75_11705 [Armatimonadetes bacterium]|nr:hypothetical protein [Armatimonadota bacterium]